MKGRVDIDGPVHVERRGSGPPMVLVHGLGSSHVHWLAVSRELGRTHRLHMPDLPGFGHTPLAGRSATVESYGRLLGRLMDELQGPAVLVGNSMGALLAMVAARERPEDVAALILVSPPAPRPLRAPLERNLAILFSAYTWPGLGEVTRELWVRLQGPEGIVRSTFEICCSSPEDVPEDVLHAARELAARRPRHDDVHAFLSAYRSIWVYLLNGWRFDRLLREIQTPTLVIRGTADRLVPPVVSDRLSRVRPDWNYVSLEGIGHMPQVDDPESFLAATSRWLTGLEARKRGAG